MHARPRHERETARSFLSKLPSLFREGPCDAPPSEQSRGEQTMRSSIGFLLIVACCLSLLQLGAAAAAAAADGRRPLLHPRFSQLQQADNSNAAPSARIDGDALQATLQGDRHPQQQQQQQQQAEAGAAAQLTPPVAAHSQQHPSSSSTVGGSPAGWRSANLRREAASGEAAAAEEETEENEDPPIDSEEAPPDLDAGRPLTCEDKPCGEGQMTCKVVNSSWRFSCTCRPGYTLYRDAYVLPLCVKQKQPGSPPDDDEEVLFGKEHSRLEQRWAVGWALFGLLLGGALLGFVIWAAVKLLNRAKSDESRDVQEEFTSLLTDKSQGRRSTKASSRASRLPLGDGGEQTPEKGADAEEVLEGRG